MFRIAICDDEATSLLIIKSLTEQVMVQEKISFEIQTFDDMLKMTEILTRPGRPFDVLLCDILASGMNGIEAAHKLRDLGEQLDIIFISSTAEYALDGYKVQALRYLKKPIEPDMLREALLLAYRKNQYKEGLSVTCEGKLYNIDFKDVIYMESQARDVDITIADGRKLTTHMKISDMEKLLPENQYFRCHRSYIVNLDQVENIERYQATMKNGELIPISQQLYSEMKNRMYNRGQR